ncbi:AraC family transcriptional regulator [Aureibacillus halotolerans]|uniref:AraC family transcriptional regulator n=1 Tax=Aureibacillus halotolerans TaxID=1508390 RepID=A0A4R6UCK2_9BACI|nr:AraC family transcriptional regulator [Aureibacillus halotolerans]TDQ40814.1 AraC family transcriptional regulator [Aureibacillus halotolerans]
MTWVESLQQAIDYMEIHLRGKLDVTEVAKQANMSPFYFQRMFTLLTGMTMGEYHRGRRLTLAAQELCTTDTKIIDIAYAFGYDTPEAFAKAFRNQHGCTPTEARNGKGERQSYNRLVIQVTLKGVEQMKYRIEERNAFSVVGLKKEFSMDMVENQHQIPQFWNQVNGDGTTDRLVALNDGDIKGVLGVCVDLSDETSKRIDYWIAAASKQETHEEFSTLKMPAAKWAVFEVHGAMPHAIQEVWEKIYSEWFPSSGYKPVGGPDFEMYTDDDPYDPNCYSEIWISVK